MGGSKDTVTYPSTIRLKLPPRALSSRSTGLSLLTKFHSQIPDNNTFNSSGRVRSLHQYSIKYFFLYSTTLNGYVGCVAKLKLGGKIIFSLGICTPAWLLTSIGFGPELLTEHLPDISTYLVPKFSTAASNITQLPDLSHTRNFPGFLHPLLEIKQLVITQSYPVSLHLPPHTLPHLTSLYPLDLINVNSIKFKVICGGCIISIFIFWIF